MESIKINLGSLSYYSGSVELPENIELFCPNCGAPCADKGANTKITFIKDYEANQLKLGVDCNCGCNNRPPAIRPVKLRRRNNGVI